MIKTDFELLAPGGDVDSIKAAIVAGADAIYCGLDKFNARNRAVNISLENLNGIVRLAHEYQCKIFVTLNIIILENEIPELIKLLNKLVKTDIDGVILQDLGLFYLIENHFPTLDVHASTQLNTHNIGQIDFLTQLGASRTNVSRELNITEIKNLAQYGNKHNMLLEVFVHGSYCIGFSGLCYISSARNGNSGNRGRCSQPCRDQYKTTQTGNNFPLNMKDNSAFDDLALLADAGVYSLKIEGRIKKPHYVYTVVDNWRKQIDRYCETGTTLTDKTPLYKVFNRDFSNLFLMGQIDKSMFIDNPRDYSALHFMRSSPDKTDAALKQVKRALYDEKTNIIADVEAKTTHLNIDKLKLEIIVNAQPAMPLLLTVHIRLGDKLLKTIKVSSTSQLTLSQQHPITLADIKERFNKLNDDKYQIAAFNTDNFTDGLSIPFKEITQLREQIFAEMNGFKQIPEPVQLPKLIKHQAACKQRLSVLISDKTQLELIDNDIDLYFQLPTALTKNLPHLLELFKNSALLPYFPAILIGDDFNAAITFLEQVKPRLIITNNTGVAAQASKNGIAWIAGPQLNITNSYALQCIQDKFMASGSFISNEINKKQIRHLVRPQNFKLFHSIYHPITLLTSRQCLFHQTVGCKLKAFDDKCLANCKKQTSIINLNTAHYVIDKQKGDHNSIYSDHNFLNTQVVTDHADLFTDWFIDLRPIKTETQINLDDQTLITQFLKLIQHDADAATTLKTQISPTTAAQYQKGL